VESICSMLLRAVQGGRGRHDDGSVYYDCVSLSAVLCCNRLSFSQSLHSKCRILVDIHSWALGKEYCHGPRFIATRQGKGHGADVTNQNDVPARTNICWDDPT
jgi:hypothetical protein